MSMGARAAAPAASTGCSVKGSPGEPWQAEDANAHVALSFGDTNRGLARELRLRRSDRAAGEEKGSPVHSTPSTALPGREDGRSSACNPSREPRGRCSHNRAFE